MYHNITYGCKRHIKYIALWLLCDYYYYYYLVTIYEQVLERRQENVAQKSLVMILQSTSDEMISISIIIL